jgi:hypothetical protein
MCFLIYFECDNAIYNSMKTITIHIIYQWYYYSYYISMILLKIFSLSRLFADDTSLSYSSSNINEIEQRLNSDITKIYFNIFWMWKCHLQFDENVTPKCLWFTTNSTSSLLKSIWGLIFTWFVWRYSKSFAIVCWWYITIVFIF